MAGIVFPDLMGTIGKVEAFKAARAQRDWLEQDRAVKSEVAGLVPQALSGDAIALGQIAARHPDTAMKLAPLLERMDAGNRARLKEATEWTTQAAMGVLGLPPEQRAAAYQQALAEGKARGYQLGDMPPQYDPAVEGRLRFIVQRAQPIADYFKNQNNAPVPVGGGVAPMPQTGGDPANVIGGMESGGRYDAIGPAANRKGQRAYGKYQVMDFNVGPWTQEVLGKTMTPQEFLANPQAQDAVFKAKFGQYQQQYGSPEAAARAWFAGPGGMNNPNAKDVLGTSVAQYGAKFNAGMGGGGPVLNQASNEVIRNTSLPQGDTPTADGSGTPLPPAQQIQTMGYQAQDISRMLPPGVRAVTRGGKLSVQGDIMEVMNPDGSLGYFRLPPNRQAKEQQAPAGYQFTPEGGLAPIPGGPADPSRQRAERVPPGYRLAADGQSLEFIPGGPADPAVAKRVGPMTEGQANAALYADRMRAAEKIILENQKAGLSVGGKALEFLPGGNLLQSEGYQLYEQARRDFINAVLRRESGAVISEQEFANAERQYFPRPGDTEAVLKQKTENRRIALEGISRAAGSSYKPETDAPKPAPAAQSPADKGKQQFDLRKKYGLE